MPPQKKTLRDESNALLARHNSFLPRRKNRLHVYVESLNERIVATRYALEQAQCYSGDVATTETYSPFSDRKEKRAFYTNAFWSFAYSNFDILAHILNMVHPVVKEESQIGFMRAADNYATLATKYRDSIRYLPVPLIKKLSTITNSNFFKRLSKYRQCCLHRRAVCIREKTTTLEVSAVYEHSSAPNESQVIAWICDDPADPIPKWTLNRILDDECQTLLKYVEEQMKDILKSL